MSGDDTLRDAAADNRHDTEHRYEASDAFIGAALEWVAQHGHEDRLVVAVACAAYRQSPEFDTVIDDALDNERRF